MTSKFAELFKHECDRQQTDDSIEKWIGIGRMACTARAIPRNNNLFVNIMLLNDIIFSALMLLVYDQEGNCC